MTPSIDLEAAKAAFFASGGCATELDAAHYVPYRPRREPETPDTKPAKSRVVRERRARIEQVRELAKRMTYAEAVAHTGLSQACLGRYALEGQFKFQPDPRRGKGNLGKKLSDPVVDRAKAEQIIAYRNLQMTRSQVVELMDISYKQLARLVREFDIDFPTTASRRAQA